MNSTDVTFQRELEIEHRGKMTDCDSQNVDIKSRWTLGKDPGAGGRGLGAQPGLTRAPGFGGKAQEGH